MPRRRSQLREALDGVQSGGELREALDTITGAGGPEDDAPPAVLAGSRRQRWRAVAAKTRPVSRKAGTWAFGLITGTLTVVIGSLIYGWLSSH